MKAKGVGDTHRERYLQRPPRIGRRRRKKTGGVWFTGAELEEPLRGRESCRTRCTGGAQGHRDCKSAIGLLSQSCFREQFLESAGSGGWYHGTEE